MSTKMKSSGIALMFWAVVILCAGSYFAIRWVILSRIITLAVLFTLTSVMFWAGWMLFSVRVRKDAR